jgi:uncharacterized membrane protein YdjX (TVP38/TMEM64 family)
MTPPPPIDASAAASRRRRLVIAGLAILAAAVLLLANLEGGLTLDRLLAHRAALETRIADNRTGSVLIYGLGYAAMVALSIPGASVGTIAAGLLFGPFVGGALAGVAGTLGATALFLAARMAIGESLARRAGPWLQRLREGFARDAVSYMLFLRLTPAFPFFIVNLVPALLGVPLRIFFWTTLVGVMPATFAFASAGAGLDSVLRAQAGAIAACRAAGRVDCAASLTPGALVTRETLLALAAMGVMALLPAVVRRLHGRGQQSE